MKCPFCGEEIDKAIISFRCMQSTFVTGEVDFAREKTLQATSQPQQMSIDTFSMKCPLCGNDIAHLIVEDKRQYFINLVLKVAKEKGV